jgi:hypothetical protein
MPETDAQSVPDMKDEDAGGGPTSHPGAQAQQDWGATSAGLTGDRVAHRDVWSAQAGTDDEAGGGVAGAGRTPEPVVDADSTQARDPNFANERTPRAPWIWIGVALVLAALLGAFLLGALSPD